MSTTQETHGSPMTRTVVAVFSIVIFLLGVLWSDQRTVFGWNVGGNLVVLAVAWFAVPVVVFWYVYDRDERFRDAIAAGFVALFFIVFASGLNKEVRDILGEEVGRVLLTNVTAAVTAITSVYIGARTAEAIGIQRAKSTVAEQARDG